MKKLLLLGAGGHGRVIADAAKTMGYTEIAFLDDAPPAQGLDHPVLGGFQDAARYAAQWDMFAAVGDPKLRERLLERLEQMGASVPVIIDGSAVIGSGVHIGAGTVVMPGAVVNSNTQIGRGCIVNTGATVDHDNILEDLVHLSPGVHLAGTVHIGARSWLGVGSAVVNNCSICPDCTIGAGAVVVRDIKKPGVYIGVPAEGKEMNGKKIHRGGG